MKQAEFQNQSFLQIGPTPRSASYLESPSLRAGEILVCLILEAAVLKFAWLHFPNFTFERTMTDWTRLKGRPNHIAEEL